jgi:hypothetical protein
LALRIVLDPVDVDLPPFTREVRTSYVLPALRYALSSPLRALELARLGMRAFKAGRSLENALRKLGPVVHSLGRAGTA